MSTGTIIPSDMPAIEGLSFRSIRGEEDADAVYALRAGCIERDQVDLLSASEGLPGCEEFRERGTASRGFPGAQEHAVVV